MSKPLLSTESSVTSTGGNTGRGLRKRLSHMGNFMQEVLAGKDDLTVAVEKACNDVPGNPKKKHLDYIIQTVRNHPEQVEEVLLRLNAMTAWSDNVVVVLKVFQCLQFLSKYCYHECCDDLEHQLIFVHEVRTVWKSMAGNAVVDKVALTALHRLTLLQDYPVLSELVLNTHICSINQVVELNRNGILKLDEVVNFVTKAMALQLDELSLLRTSLDVSTLATYNTPERDTIEAYRELIQEELTEMLLGVTNLCSYVQQVDQGRRVNVVLLREELDNQQAELRRLRDLGSKLESNRI